MFFSKEIQKFGQKKKMEGKIIFNLEVMHNYDGAEKMGATSCVVHFGEIWEIFESFHLEIFSMFPGVFMRSSKSKH